MRGCSGHGEQPLPAVAPRAARAGICGEDPRIMDYLLSNGDCACFFQGNGGRGGAVVDCDTAAASLAPRENVMVVYVPVLPHHTQKSLSDLLVRIARKQLLNSVPNIMAVLSDSINNNCCKRNTCGLSVTKKGLSGVPTGRGRGDVS